MAFYVRPGFYHEEPEREGMFWSVICDGCGDDMNEGQEFDAWADPADALEHAEAGGNDHTHFCYECWQHILSGYSETEFFALTEPATEPQGYMAAVAAKGYVARALDDASRRPQPGGMKR